MTAGTALRDHTLFRATGNNVLKQNTDQFYREGGGVGVGVRGRSHFHHFLTTKGFNRVYHSPDVRRLWYKVCSNDKVHDKRSYIPLAIS